MYDPMRRISKTCFSNNFNKTYIFLHCINSFLYWHGKRRDFELSSKFCNQHRIFCKNLLEMNERNAFPNVQMSAYNYNRISII